MSRASGRTMCKVLAVMSLESLREKKEIGTEKIYVEKQWPMILVKNINFPDAR